MSDRAAQPVEAPATEDEIPVSPEMIEAGVKVLWSSGSVENPVCGADELIVRQIFLAMIQASKPWLSVVREVPPQE